MSKQIRDIKIIHHTGEIDQPDDPTLPFKLEMTCSPPQFMSVAFIALYGGAEEIIVRAKTKKALDTFMEENGLRRHPRLRRFTITGPDDFVEQYP